MSSIVSSPAVSCVPASSTPSLSIPASAGETSGTSALLAGMSDGVGFST